MKPNNNLVTWSSTYSVGVKLIDKQHKELLNLVNDMYNHVIGDETIERAYFQEVIQQTLDYVKIHFDTEEKIMKLVKFQGYVEHKKAHDSFIYNVFDMVKKFEAGKKGPLISFTHFIKDWILTHIAIMDKQYFEYFKKIAVRNTNGSLSIIPEKIAC